VPALLLQSRPSIPFYTEKDVVFERALASASGRKNHKSDKPNVWEFEGTTNKTYKLTITEKEGKQGKV